MKFTDEQLFAKGYRWTAAGALTRVENFDSGGVEGHAGCVIRVDSPGRLPDTASQRQMADQTSLPADTAPPSRNQARPAVNSSHKPAIRVPRRSRPNATEQRWLNERGFLRWPDCYFRYEALSFRLESGAGYCPDWTAWRAGELVACVEVKGGYDHGSHSRSALAWKTAAAEWPEITWIWARWKDGKWDETTIEPRRREP